MGRDNKYEKLVKPHLEDIKKWRNEGWTEKSIYLHLGVSCSSFELYKKTQEELQNALDTGKSQLVNRVKNSLIEKALAGNMQAIFYFLNNYGDAMTEYQKQMIELKKEENRIRREQNEILKPIITDDLITELVEDLKNDK